MKYALKLGVVFLIGALAGTPLAACMSPGAVTTEEEAACCSEMASQCDEGDMPSSHSCCKKLSVPDQAVLAKRPFHLFQQFSPLYILQQHPDFVQELPQVFSSVASFGHSPPESPPVSSEILRI